jgi:ubiquinone/menaquinone biosynthesis C-methylase UbiE
MKAITKEKIKKMGYVELMAFLEEVNRPPGGKNSIRLVVQNCFITKDSKVLDIGCNTGYVSFEIAHLAKCKVIGIDINKNIIKVAEKIRKREPLGHLIKFKVADAMNLPFPDETFDVVVSGGSTAFIEDKLKALKEYKRVLKQWGFIADINFFYRIKPPTSLLKRLTSILEVEIQPWDINYWINLYEQCDLEKYFIYTNHIKPVSQKEVKNYCSVMAKEKNLPKEIETELKNKLTKIMSVFNENHKYLDYGIFILRKRPQKEQISLFGV